MSVVSDVVEVIEGRDDARVLLTCEHASNALPAPWAWPDEDRWLIETHWAIDLGIAAVTRHLAQAIDAPAVLAKFSRLLCDANRPLDAETLFRTIADGHPVRLNQALTDAERIARIRRLHEPYHATADALLARYPHAVVLSMHSFTPVYQDGPPRPMEIGVLFDQEEQISVAIAESMAADGWRVALNEPYSGKDGLIYAADRHATRHHRRALELEVRQDVALDGSRHAALVHSIRRALIHAGV
ncbi:MAG: N-formylglutamate amidohydrolase [Myxococcota bacterium]